MRKNICMLLWVLMFIMGLSGCGCKHVWIAPTCESAGICSVCGEISGAPVGHTWLEATCEKGEVCSICDKARENPLGHDWKEATCDSAKYCLRCGVTEGNPLEHIWVEATCVEPKSCELCAITEGEPLGHSYGEMQVVKEATCDAYGRKEAICLLCADIIGEDIDLIEHEYTTVKVIEKATCTTIGIEERTCIGCGDVITQETLMKDHEVGKWTISVKANCGVDGLKVAACKGCGKKYEEVIPKTEKHQFNKWKTSVEPTCTVGGKNTRICKICKFEETKSVDALGHNYQEGIVKEATYYEKGLKGQVCANCGKQQGKTTDYIKYNKIKLRSVFDDYRKNEISAEEKYNNMYVEFSGKISKIEHKDLSYGKIHIEVKNNTYWEDDVDCKIKTKEQVEKVKSMAVGDNVTIKGKVNFGLEGLINRCLYVDIIEIK